MKTILVVLLLLITAFTYSQECATKFHTFSLYAHTQGGGIEFGQWATEGARFGYFGGMFFSIKDFNYLDPSKGVVTSKVLFSQGYFKTTYRFNRYFFATAQIGIEEMEAVILAGGIRLCIPLKNGNYAFYIEPQISTQGSVLIAAFSIPILPKTK